MKENSISNLRKIKFFVKKTIHFFTVKIWLLSAEVGLSAFKKTWYKTSRILTVTLESFWKNNCFIRASSLTYYTLFAVVPLFALVYVIAILFGLEHFLTNQIKLALGGEAWLSEKLIDIAHNTIIEARNGVITIVALIFFFWSIVSMLSSVEETMNKIWNIKKRRTYLVRIAIYFLFMIIGTILIVVGSAANIFISANIIYLFPEIIQKSLNFLSSFFVPIGIFSLLFFVIYQGTPNVKISPRSSFWAAILAGTVFQFLQFYYFNIQMSISAYNAIYGSFAALPLLLVWIKLSWIIFLFGAELAYGIEHERNFTSSQQSHQPSHNP